MSTSRAEAPAGPARPPRRTAASSGPAASRPKHAAMEAGEAGRRLPDVRRPLPGRRRAGCRDGAGARRLVGRDLRDALHRRGRDARTRSPRSVATGAEFVGLESALWMRRPGTDARPQIAGSGRGAGRVSRALVGLAVACVLRGSALAAVPPAWPASRARSVRPSRRASPVKTPLQELPSPYTPNYARRRRSASQRRSRRISPTAPISAASTSPPSARRRSGSRPNPRMPPR